jgi:hypothetical protein
VTVIFCFGGIKIPHFTYEETLPGNILFYSSSLGFNSLLLFWKLTHFSKRSQLQEVSYEYTNIKTTSYSRSSSSGSVQQSLCFAQLLFTMEELSYARCASAANIVRKNFDYLGANNVLINHIL